MIATEVSLEQVIRQQVDPFGSPRIRLAGPVVTVPAFVVQPLALVIHELVVNAVAHGTRSTPNGNLSVQWENDPTHGGFTLRWEQVGGQADVDAAKVGLGARGLVWGTDGAPDFNRRMARTTPCADLFAGFAVSGEERGEGP